VVETVRLSNLNPFNGADHKFGDAVAIHIRNVHRQSPGAELAVDADQRQDIAWEAADTKRWWPQAEAMYAVLLAWEHVQESWCLPWYDKLHEYCFTHYPVPDHGEWYRNLNRQGQPMTEVIVMPVKDPFHLPRNLIYCIDVLDRIIQRTGQAV
jgi:N-acylglucosamine 2-epimerase